MKFLNHAQFGLRRLHSTLTRREPKFLTDKAIAFIERYNKYPAGNILASNITPNEKSVNLMSNDYLKLADHPLQLEAKIKSLSGGDDNDGYFMSGVYQHYLHNNHKEFERALADHISMGNTLLYQSGYCANIGVVQVASDKDKPIYIDRLSHMSFLDGVTVAEGKPVPFKHNNVDHLVERIKKYGEGTILVAAVYSPDGTVSPLADIVDVAHRYNCVLVVDESHSLGLFGKHGGTMSQELGLQDYIHFTTGSLSKGFAGRAGFIGFNTPSHSDLLACSSHPAIFSSVVLPNDVAGLHAVLEIMKNEPWRREAMWKNAKYLRNGLNELGFNVEGGSHIIPIIPGFEKETAKFRDALEERDVFGSLYCSPATTLNGSMMRFTVHSDLQENDLKYFLSVIEEIKNNGGTKNWISSLESY